MRVKSFFPILLIILLGLWRLISMHYEIGAAYTPFCAMALFSGACFHAKPIKAYVWAVSVLLISDILLMKVFYPAYASGFLYSGWIWNYACFLGVVYIGQRFLRQARWPKIALHSLLTAVLYWLIIDFFVWIGGGFNILTQQPYTKDFYGLMQCYMLALPFLKNMFIGNILYSGLLFGLLKVFEQYAYLFEKIKLDKARKG